MNGIINILKPIGMTSTDVVRWIKRKIKIDKVGHIGTLDPGATGVLPICVGKATKLVQFYSQEEKSYRAEITLGITTDTQDAFGRELSKIIPQVTLADLKRVLSKFRGNITQIPPMFSAVRKQGKHLYDYARQGIEIERPEREVSITKLELISWQDDVFPKALLDIECSKGTYIRTLCQDIGEELGCGAHMSFLLRLRAGKFTLDSSYTLEEIEYFLAKKDESFVLSPDWGLTLPEVRIPQSRLIAFKNGLPSSRTMLRGVRSSEGQLIKVYCDKQFLGIGIWKNDSLYPNKVLI
ncbi:MAG TPA: tRNA pseudouridine(55) synthase TruB [Peptococcaceae bacterium]|nr:tRNA pseudouridine(55) synthase TruB [Peptococcaceae bacterium]